MATVRFARYFLFATHMAFVPYVYGQTNSSTTQCRLSGLQTGAEISEAISCVDREISLAISMTEDLRATVSEILGSFDKAIRYAVESNKANAAFKRTGDKALLVIRDDYDSLYRQAFINYEKNQSRLGELRKSYSDANRVAELLKSKLDILKEYGKIVAVEKK